MLQCFVKRACTLTLSRRRSRCSQAPGKQHLRVQSCLMQMPNLYHYFLLFINYKFIGERHPLVFAMLDLCSFVVSANMLHIW